MIYLSDIALLKLSQPKLNLYKTREPLVMLPYFLDIVPSELCHPSVRLRYESRAAQEAGVHKVIIFVSGKYYVHNKSCYTNLLGFIIQFLN